MTMIYLDNNATTKPFPEVVEAMTQFMTSRYWNASSAYGQLDGLEEVVESAKKAVRNLIGATPCDEVVFTSGATESNAWAVAEGARRTRNHGWILSSQIEHPSVLMPLDRFQKEGGDVRWVPVTCDGSIDLDKLAELVDGDLRFASLMLAHNETGVIQPLQEAAVRIRERAPQCIIHTDATQAIGKIPISLSNDYSAVDLFSFSCHKFHGPKGIGGLVIGENAQIEPLILGGGQQDGFRSGTLNLPGIVGASIAAAKSSQSLIDEKHLSAKAIRDYFEKNILSLFNEAFILGARAPRLPNTSFLGIPGVDADDLVHALAAEGIAIGKGSSCSAQSIQPSKAAMYMGLNFSQASCLIRFSGSIGTTYDEVDVMLEKLLELV